MKPGVTWFLSWFAFAVSVAGQALPAPANFTPGVGYTLIDGSYFIDDCLICGRPTIQRPMFGSFELVPVQNTPPYTRYTIRNLDFFTDSFWGGVSKIVGSGVYTRFEEFALLQHMELSVWLMDAMTNRPAYFTNDSGSVEKPFPMIQIHLSQTNGTLVQTFSMEVVAVPVREVWFSTARAFQCTNDDGVTNDISAGDLIANRGRVVKHNVDLVGRLGIMPTPPTSLRCPPLCQWWRRSLLPASPATGPTTWSAWVGGRPANSAR